MELGAGEEIIVAGHTRAPLVDPEIVEEADVFGQNIVTLVRDKFPSPCLNGQDHFDREAIENCKLDHGRMVSLIATNGPEESRRLGGILQVLQSRGLQSVSGLPNVLFVDLSDIFVSLPDNPARETLIKSLGKAALVKLLTSLRDNGIDVREYPKFTDAFQFEQALDQELGLSSPFSFGNIFFEVVKELGIGERKGFLKGRKSVHVFPLFQFGEHVLPYSNSAVLPPQVSDLSLTPETSAEVVKAYQFASIVGTFGGGSGWDRDGYGPFGRMIILPEVVTYALSSVARPGSGQFSANLTSSIQAATGHNIRQQEHVIDRIRGSFPVMFDRMTREPAERLGDLSQQGRPR